MGGVLEVEVDRPVIVYVDGAVIDFRDDAPFLARTAPLRDARHEVSIKRVTGVELWHGTVEVPDQWAVGCSFTKGAFACTDASWLHGAHTESANGDRAYPAPPAYGVVVVVQPPNPRPPPPPPRAPETPPAPPVPSSVDLIVRTLDRQWMFVKVDGATVIDLKNASEGKATMKPGLHTIEFFEFMADAPYARVKVDTKSQATLTLGAGEEKVPECYDCGAGVWTVVP